MYQKIEEDDGDDFIELHHHHDEMDKNLFLFPDFYHESNRGIFRDLLDRMIICRDVQDLVELDLEMIQMDPCVHHLIPFRHEPILEEEDVQFLHHNRKMTEEKKRRTGRKYGFA